MFRKLILAALLLMPAPALAQQCTSGAIGASPVTQVQASATGTTGAVSATLPALAGKYTYLCGFSITSGGATTATTRAVTITGTPTTLNYAYVDPTATQGNIDRRYTICLASSAPNTAIAVTVPGTGTGTVAIAVNLWGCYQ